MDLLERYLQAVRFFLPRRLQADVIRELSENLMSEIEEREDELGRRLNDAELAEILRRHGHPMVVAGRYRTRQHLIGPVFFPMYVFTLKLGLGVSLLVTTVVGAITAALRADPAAEAIRLFSTFPKAALMVFAWTTIGFAIVDHAHSRLKFAGEWDPRSLPKVVRHDLSISRSRTLCELILLVLALAWLLAVPWNPQLALGPAAAVVDATPIWRTVYLPMVLLAIATLVLAAVNLLRPYWTPARSLARIAVEAAGLIVAVVVVRSGPWFVAQALEAPRGPQIEHLVEWMNRGVQIAVVVTVLIKLIEIGKEIYKLKTRRGQAPVHSSSDHAHLTL